MISMVAILVFCKSYQSGVHMFINLYLWPKSS